MIDINVSRNYDTMQLFEIILENSISSTKPKENLANVSVTPGNNMFYRWVILASGFVVAAIIYGFYYSFGVYFTSLQQDFGANRASIALISSIIIGLQNGMGFFSGWVVDKYGPRLIVIIGGTLFSAGLIISSHANSVTQLYVSLGVMIGTAMSSLFNPYIVALSKWFVQKRGLAQGILSAGAGLGMMLGAPIAMKLLTQYGWRTSFFIIGVSTIAIFATSAYLARRSPLEEENRRCAGSNNGTSASAIQRNSLTLREAMHKRELWLFVGRGLTLPSVIFMITTHLVNYAKDSGLSPGRAALMMTIVGATGTFGKVLAGHLADKYGSKKIQVGSAALLTILMFWLATGMNVSLFPIFAFFYGFAYGGSFSTSQVLMAEVFGVSHMGTIFGFTSISGALGSVMGPWLAGYIFDSTNSYSLAFLVAACSAATTTVIILFIRSGSARMREVKNLPNHRVSQEKE